MAVLSKARDYLQFWQSHFPANISQLSHKQISLQTAMTKLLLIPGMQYFFDLEN